MCLKLTLVLTLLTGSEAEEEVVVEGMCVCVVRVSVIVSMLKKYKGSEMSVVMGIVLRVSVTC
jgi:hypothetical protein